MAPVRALVLAALAALSVPATATPVDELLGAVADRTGRPVPAYLAAWATRDREWGSQHRVLVQMAAGRSAFLRGDWDHAEALLADAQREIETVYANDPKAEAARSVFVPEATKPFKGDPYERAMVGVYLGLIDLSRGDFDNARAGFRFAQLQDTMSASEKYQDDMALAQYLVGWTYWCEGRATAAAEEFERARALRPALAAPAAGERLLMLAEVGDAPVKFRAGTYGELQRLRGGAPTPVQQVAFRTGSGAPLPATLAEDLVFQAGTRGGAAVDSIRAGKASFRQGADVVTQAGAGVGLAALGAAAFTSGRDSRDLAGVAVVAGLVSLAAKGVASSTETLADVRYWPNLPERFFLRTAALPAGTPTVEAGYYGFGGRPLQAGGGRLQVTPRRDCALFIGQAPPAQRADPAVADRWPALPPLQPGPGRVNLDHLVAQDIGDEGESLLDSVRRTRETAR
jgi:tetratricopeptide (TPR) repeat protein